MYRRTDPASQRYSKNRCFLLGRNLSDGDSGVAGTGGLKLLSGKAGEVSRRFCKRMAVGEKTKWTPYLYPWYLCHRYPTVCIRLRKTFEETHPFGGGHSKTDTRNFLKFEL